MAAGSGIRGCPVRLLEPSQVLDGRPAGATSRADSAGERPSLLC